MLKFPSSRFNTHNPQHSFNSVRQLQSNAILGKNTESFFISKPSPLFTNQSCSFSILQNKSQIIKDNIILQSPVSIQTRNYAKRRVVRRPKKRKTATAVKEPEKVPEKEQKNVIDLTPEPVQQRTIEDTSEAMHLLSELGENEAIREILMQDSIVITRDIEWGTVLAGFEQANRYCIKDTTGKILGYVAEENSIGKTLLRNVTTTHRSFVAHIFDPQGNIILRIRRPFFFFVSQMQLEDSHGNIIGEIKQRWHLWRRKYDMFLGKKQFAMVDAPFLSIDFDLMDEKNQRLASVNRNFTGFARTIFTDGNEYAVWFKDTTGEGQARTLTLEERAVVLASAVAMDFDYFSHHSGGPGLLSWLPIPIPAPAPAEQPQEDSGEAVADESEGGKGLMGDNYEESNKYEPKDNEESDDVWDDNDNGGGILGNLGDFWGNNDDDEGGNDFGDFWDD